MKNIRGKKELCVRCEKELDSENKPIENTTFKDTAKYLVTHGWEKLKLKQYIIEKDLRKHQTARIGKYGYFKLKKSDEEIKNARM